MEFQEMCSNYKQKAEEVILAHFQEFDDWTMNELEELYGDVIVNLEGMFQEDYDEWLVSPYGVPLGDAKDEAYMRNRLEELSVDELLKLSRQFEEPISEPMPYRIIILAGNLPENEPIREGDIVEEHICIGEKALYDKLEELLQNGENDGLPFALEDAGGELQRTPLTEYYVEFVHTYLPKVSEPEISKTTRQADLEL